MDENPSQVPSDAPTPTSEPVIASGTPTANELTHGADGAPIELVFGLVGPTGVDLVAVCDALKAQLRAHSYKPQEISLSRLILRVAGIDEKPLNAFQRLDTLILTGNKLCEDAKQNDIVGRLGLAEIRDIREQITGSKYHPHKTEKIAYIVKSFKRKEEIELYRNTYGRAFTLISAYASSATRMRVLQERFRSCEIPEDLSRPNGRKLTPKELATRIIGRDYEEEEEKFGQRVGKTFPLADFFVTTDRRKASLEQQFRRLVRLTLGDPYISPTRDEQGMFFAQAAALRSLDLSRQVGAAVVSSEGDVLTTGCNEVPKKGGGLYWADDKSCARDLEAGKDANVSIKTELVEDAIRLLRSNGFLSESLKDEPDAYLAKRMLIGEGAFFRNSKLFDVIEFGRSVHAEMAAISQAARLGVSLQGAKLFCTTFPCHICARHILAAGISEVFFIEPYEKSRVRELYWDSIVIEPEEETKSQASFLSFVGVAPRRYMEYFQLSTERKKEDGKILDMTADEMKPKLRRFVFTYLLVEQKFVDQLQDMLKPRGESS